MQSRNPNGRPKGSRNKTSLEVADFCRKMVESREYRVSLKQRLLEGKASHMEPLIWAYAYGRPLERIQIIGPILSEVERLASLYNLTPEEVIAEAELIAQGRA